MPLKLVNIRIEKEDDEKLDSIARNNRKPKAELYREAISEYLSKYDGRLSIGGCFKRINELEDRLQVLKQNQEMFQKILDAGEPKIFRFPLVQEHRDLKQYGKAVLTQLGFLNEEIFEEHGTGLTRVDLAGISNREELNFSLAIECGTLPKRKFSKLISLFDLVLHIPYTLTPETFPYPTSHQVAYQIWSTRRSLLKKGIME